MTLDRRDFIKLGAASSVALWLETLLGPLKLMAGEIDGSIPEMIYKPFGKTGKDLSILSMGGLRYPYNDGDPEEAIKLIVKAYELGVNYFDTAPNYVEDTSEEITGLAMKEIDRINAGKNNPLPYYWGTKSSIGSDKTADDVMRRIETSLKRLGKDKIPYYFMWCFKDLDHHKAVIAKGGPYDGALKAKKDGLIDHILFSTHATGEENIAMLNDNIYEGMLIGYNFTNFPRQEEAIQLAHKKNVGVIVMNPLAGGLIPRNQQFFEQKLKKSGTGMSLVQTALAFCMGQREINITLSGMENQQQLMENIKTINYLNLFDEKRLAALKAQYLEGLEGICTTCQYCNICPLEIPVYEIMRAYNSKILDGMGKFQEWIDWYKDEHDIDVKAEIEKCVECGICEKACTQKLDITGRFKEIAKEI